MRLVLLLRSMPAWFVLSGGPYLGLNPSHVIYRLCCADLVSYSLDPGPYFQERKPVTEQLSLLIGGKREGGKSAMERV